MLTQDLQSFLNSLTDEQRETFVKAVRGLHQVPSRLGAVAPRERQERLAEDG